MVFVMYPGNLVEEDDENNKSHIKDIITWIIKKYIFIYLANKYKEKWKMSRL